MAFTSEDIVVDGTTYTITDVNEAAKIKALTKLTRAISSLTSAVRK